VGLNRQLRFDWQGNKLLSTAQIIALRSLLLGRKILVCYGAGVDSTALLVVLWLAGIRPDLITFADTGGEKPETYAHLARMNEVLRRWGWPEVVICRKRTKESTPYVTLQGECMANETLPAIAFGIKACSVKWKQEPQDQYLMGVKSGPNAREPHSLWIETQSSGTRIVKLFGYDSGRADLRRSRNLPLADEHFDRSYPLQVLGWVRADCVHIIVQILGLALVPIKSACWFCPASRRWELYWLAAFHPDLLEQALEIERNALTGRHSRFETVEFGDDWDELVRDAVSFPSSKTTVGLGRSFSWNRWARTAGIVDQNFKVRRELSDQFLQLARALQSEDDNALDARACA
jgi:hypothetical protein